MFNEITVTYDSDNSFTVEVQKADGHCPSSEVNGHIFVSYKMPEFLESHLFQELKNTLIFR